MYICILFIIRNMQKFARLHIYEIICRLLFNFTCKKPSKLNNLSPVLFYLIQIKNPPKTFHVFRKNIFDTEKLRIKWAVTSCIFHDKNERGFLSNSWKYSMFQCQWSTSRPFQMSTNDRSLILNYPVSSPVLLFKCLEFQYFQMRNQHFPSLPSQVQ